MTRRWPSPIAEDRGSILLQPPDVERDRLTDLFLSFFPGRPGGHASRNIQGVRGVVTVSLLND